MSRSNACLVCRGRKVRCDRFADGTSRCSTCVKLDRDCVARTWTPEIIWPSDRSARAAGDYVRSVDTTSRGLQLFSGKLDPCYYVRWFQLLTFDHTAGERAYQVALILAATRHRSLDQLLSQLDVDIELAEGDETLCAGPFGVLRLKGCQNDNSPVHSTQDDEESIMNSEWENFILGDFSVDKPVSGLEVGFFDSTSDHRGIYEQGLDLSFLSPMLDDATAGFVMTPIEPYVPGEDDMQLLSLRGPPTSQLQRSVSVGYAPDLLDLDVPTIRLLLAHYQEKLIPTFAPIQAQGKAVWERVHIPRVYETLGEILVKGNSGDAKCTLLFAVLSAASYHLDAVGDVSPHQSATVRREMASIFRQRAKARLASTLKTLALARSRDAYEEMLLAILSMVTVCVRRIS